ncbi:MAG: ROK family protein [Candidatus Omnitrophica bacterium]|nr:ROK family protein [Candidatus Omnitrophota bacterium]
MATRFIISIDLGGTNLKIALLDPRYRILSRETLHTRKFSNKNTLIAAIVYAVNKVKKENRLNKNNILGVGLGLPGSIDIKRGSVHFFPNIPGWKDVKLRGILERKLGLPVFMDNDANLMGLAECTLGAAKGARNAVCITLGTGVGGGIILEGKLYRGSSYAAGEIGHIPLNEYGPKCNCGGRACIEAYIGNKRITQEAKRVFKRNISLEELSRLANSGHSKARAIWIKAGRRLGMVLAGVINLLNPDCVVIGGGIANAGKVLFDKIRSTVAEQAMPVQAKHVRILRARLGNDAGLIGAAILAAEKA